MIAPTSFIKDAQPSISRSRNCSQQSTALSKIASIKWVRMRLQGWFEKMLHLYNKDKYLREKQSKKLILMRNFPGVQHIHAHRPSNIGKAWSYLIAQFARNSTASNAESNTTKEYHAKIILSHTRETTMKSSSQLDLSASNVRNVITGSRNLKEWTWWNASAITSSVTSVVETSVDVNAGRKRRLSLMSWECNKSSKCLMVWLLEKKEHKKRPLRDKWELMNINSRKEWSLRVNGHHYLIDERTEIHN